MDGNWGAELGMGKAEGLGRRQSAGAQDGMNEKSDEY